MQNKSITIFEQIFQSLNEAQVKYLVVGGIAVNLHGYMRFSADLDILLLLERENVEKFSTVIQKLGYTERLPVSIMDLTDEEQVQKWMKEKNMKAFSLVPSKDNPLLVDIIVAESLDFEEFAKNQENKAMKGIDIPVVSIEDLIKMKKRAGRPQDNADVEALEELRNI